MEQNQSQACASNTHAGNTGQNASNLCVDWVTASFKTAHDMQQILQFFGITETENLEMKLGARYEFAGYNLTYTLGHMEFMTDQNEKWLLNFSGKACRDFELYSPYDFPMLFALLANFYATYTRLDLAVDIYDSRYPVSLWRNAVYRKECVTRLTDWDSNYGGKIVDGAKLTKDSFYLGSKSSRYSVNIYNKRLERLANGYECEYPDWTRFELRLKAEYAEQFVYMILRNRETIGANMYAFLNEKICFLKTSALLLDKNKSRLAKNIENHARWWRSFLNTTKKLKITVYKPFLPLNKSKGWLLDKVSTSMAMFNLYYQKEQDFEEFVRVLVAEGLEKMKKQHLTRVANQMLIDDYVESTNNVQDLHWFKNEVAATKYVPIARPETKKEKEEYEQALMDRYYEMQLEQENLVGITEEEYYSKIFDDMAKEKKLVDTLYE